MCVCTCGLWASEWMGQVDSWVGWVSSPLRGARVAFAGKRDAVVYVPVVPWARRPFLSLSEGVCVCVYVWAMGK